MSKYRIYKLAEEFKTDSKTILDILKKHNIQVRDARNTVGDKERELLAGSLRQSTNSKAQVVVTEGHKSALTSASKNVPTTLGKHQLPEKNNQHKNDRQKKMSNNLHTSHVEAGRENHSPEHKQFNNGKNRHGNSSNMHGKMMNNTEKNNTNRNKFVGQQKTSASSQHGNNVTKQKSNIRGQKQQNVRGQKTNTQHVGHNSSNNRNNMSGARNHEQRNHEHGNHRVEAKTNSSGKYRENSMKDNKKNLQKRNNNNHNRFANNKNTMNNGNANKRSGKKNWRGNNRNNKEQVPVQKQEIVRPKLIKVGESISVKELASKMTYAATDVIKKLMMLGCMATINQEIDYDTAALVAEEFNIKVEELPPEVDLTEIPEYEDKAEDLIPRSPVVTVMGHVDHGKTSLLDVIRKTSVTSSEAGGITQHIGAYQVMCNGKKITFLDTPGHEAFTAMRARGAQATDIAVLVVAADDGVMPQTLEAINHAKSAKVPIVVAINKIDKPGANPENVKQQLANHELIAEDWGGDTIMVPVSAKKKQGIGELLEMILLVAEVQELKANPNHQARGIIIEARLDKGRGPVATVLVQNGTLHIGDSIVAGTAFGKVRAMINDRGEKVKKAGPAMPVEVLGLSDVPEAGDEMAALEEHLAKTIAEKRIEKQRTELINNKKVSLDDLFQQISAGNIKDFNILLKADVQGSLEALSSSLLGLNKSDEVRINIIHAAVGAVNESDVMLASASNALVIAFNVRPDNNARRVADTEKVDIRTYRVIYEAISDIEAAMKGMLAPKYKEVIQGKVEIRQVMKFSKALVAGSYVLEGKITNTSDIRILRDNIVVFEGKLDSLRRFKDDVKEVAAGFECGITIDGYRDFKAGDIIEPYIMEEIKQ